MRKNSILAWIILITIGILPVLPLLLEKSIQELFAYSDLTHLLGQIAGLIGMNLFALTFVLSARFRFVEDLFGGLDKVYLAHRFIGSLALVCILFHPILLVLKYIPSSSSLAASYLLPGHSLAVDMGIYSLLGMILLIFITFYTKLRYDRWKFSHRFFGLAFILAVLHIFLVRDSIARDQIFAGYYIYASIVSLIGIAAFLYSTLLKGMLVKRYEYEVESVKAEDSYTDITLRPRTSSLDHLPGQFVFITFFNEKISREPHPFSIASGPKDGSIRLVIKKLGDYTSKLGELKAGDKALIEGPYGRFTYGKPEHNKIWIAGGIGITPFIAMAESLGNDTKKTHLYYCVKKENDFLSLNLFRKLEKINRNFKIIPWASSEKGRLTVHDIYSNSGRFKNDEFYICGPKIFKDSLIESLMKNGVSRNMINEEDFEFR